MSKYTPRHTVVWTEIPVTDLPRAKAFYASILQSELTDQEMGPFPTVILPRSQDDSVAGHLYVGKPAAPGTGITLHLAAPGPLEESLERVKAAGGKVVSDIVEIPDGRFAYCTDLDGNSFGLFA